MQDYRKVRVNCRGRLVLSAYLRLKLACVWGADRLGWLALIHEDDVVRTLAVQSRTDEVAETFIEDSFKALRAPHEVEPTAGFASRVLHKIAENRDASIWTVFAESLLPRRLTYAALTALVFGGTYLVSKTETSPPANPLTPEAILAGTDTNVGNDPAKERDAALVNLTSYQE
jgi:hypothetical protein